MAAPEPFSTDPQSGRPLAPLWWSMFNWAGVAAGLLSALSLLLSYEAVRHGEKGVAVGAAAFGVMTLVAVYIEARRIRRNRMRFDAQVDAYERALSELT